MINQHNFQIKDRKNIILPGKKVSAKEISIYLDKALMLQHKLEINYAHSTPQLSHEKHLNEYLGRIIIVLSGTFITIAAFDGKISTKSLEENSIFVGGINNWNNLIIPQLNCETVSIILSNYHLRIVVAQFQNNKIITNPYFHLSTSLEKFRDLFKLLDNIIYEDKKTSYQRDERTIVLINFILLTIKQEIFSFQRTHIANPIPDIARKILFYIEINYSAEIDVSSTCADLNINRSYGSTIFKKYYKKSIRDYIMELRLNKAKNLLLNSTLSVNSISSECGFAGSNYFIRYFKKQNNMTPNEFRKGL